MKFSTVIAFIFAIVLGVFGIVETGATYIAGIFDAFNRSLVYGWFGIISPVLIIISWCLLSALDDSK